MPKRQINLKKTNNQNIGKPLTGELAMSFDANGNLIIKDENGTTRQVSFLSNFDLNKKEFIPINTDYDLSNLTPEVIFADTTAGNTTITIPLSNTLPNDGLLHCFYIAKSSFDSNEVIIQLSGAEKFPPQFSKIELKYPNEVTYIGGSYGLGWFYIAPLKIVNQINRLTTWAAANFLNPTAIPFQNIIISDNNEILEWLIANPSQIICKVKTRIVAHYHYTIDSTGGNTWNVVAYLRKNGQNIIEGSEDRTGNFGAEDSSGGRSNINIEMNPGDYLEVVIDQANLTGNLYFADFQLETIL